MKENRFNATLAMREVFHSSVEIARSSATLLIAAAKAAHESMVDLPATNEDGNPVLHGANRRMEFISNELMGAFDGLMAMTGRDFHDMLRYTHRYGAFGYSPRFHTEEEWAKIASHLEQDIARLKARIGTDKEDT